MARIHAKARPRARQADKGHLTEVAQKTLWFFEEMVRDAETRLAAPPPSSATVFASLNTLTGDKAVQSLSRVSEERRRELSQLCREPAIARVVVVDGAGKRSTYFIARATPFRTPVGEAQVASYRSPVGRLASLPVGDELEVQGHGQTRSLEIIEKVALRPTFRFDQWDAIDSVLHAADYGPVTIASLRALLEAPQPDGNELLDAFLAEGRAEENVFDGIRRAVIAKMGLRDQPALDQFQDEIFRLDLDSQLVILGPPGAGKTTTLIKRLGLKLDLVHLGDSERRLVGATVAGLDQHPTSWLMFTPTELLKQYVQEAFAREGIAAPDVRIQTWADYRLDLARNRFSMLRTAANAGSLVLKTNCHRSHPTLSLTKQSGSATSNGTKNALFGRSCNNTLSAWRPTTTRL